MAGKVALSTKHSQFSATGEYDNSSIISKTEYDKLGRSVRSLYKNTDSSYDGNKAFQLLSETEYLDSENAIKVKSYLGDEDNSYRVGKVINDWLGRGKVEELSYPGKNGSGEAVKVKYSYDFAGNLSLKEVNNGEKYRYIYNSDGKLEKSLNSDGTYSIINYDNNGNVYKSKDRRGITVINSYNKSDLLVSSLSDNLEIERPYTHMGPAKVTETENSSEVVSNEYEYHFSSGVIKNTQVIDSAITQILESGYDNAGNQISVTVTGSGGSGYEWSKTLNLDNQYYDGSTDEDHFNKTAILDGTTAKIINESSYAGVLSKIKYGTTQMREIAYSYENFLRVKSLVSNEATLELNIDITRDFTGNILSRETNTCTYDGMSRLLSGKGEDYKYDEASNLLSRGDKSYEYQPIGDTKSQMRLKSFTDGASSYGYTYDENGNATVVTGKFTALSYDNFNRLSTPL